MKVRNKLDRPLTIVNDPPIAVEAGGVAEVPAELGKSLVEQTDRWEAVTTQKSTKSVTDGDQEE